MSQLRCHIEDYLALRRALGFKLDKPGRLLPGFAAFAEAAGAGTVTIDLALRWAVLPAGVSPVWAAQRLSMVRGFARYLQTVDPAAQVPPADLLPARIRRVAPCIYSDADVTALMATARRLRNPLKAATFETLIGLLAVTGLRGSEAMGLDRDDLGDDGVLTVRATKFRKSRQVPLHQSTLRVLDAYQAQRDQLCLAPATASLLVSATGARLCHATIQPAFRHLIRQAGIGQAARARPTIHGLRHYVEFHINATPPPCHCCTPASTSPSSRSGSGTSARKQPRSISTPTRRSNNEPSTGPHHPASAPAATARPTTCSPSLNS